MYVRTSPSLSGKKLSSYPRLSQDYRSTDLYFTSFYQPHIVISFQDRVSIIHVKFSDNDKYSAIFNRERRVWLRACEFEIISPHHLPARNDDGVNRSILRVTQQ